MFAGSVGDPCTGAATATAATISGATASAGAVTVPTGCTGRLVLTVLDGGAAVAVGAADVVAGTTVVPVGGYAPSASLTVQAVVDGWGLPTSWVPPAPAVSCRVVNHPVATCSFAISSFTAWAEPWPGVNKFELNGVITGAHNANGQIWELTFNFANSYYPFVPRSVQSNGGLVPQSGCAQLPQLTVRGNADWAGPYNEIRAGETRSVYIQGYLSSPGNLLMCP